MSRIYWEDLSYEKQEQIRREVSEILFEDEDVRRDIREKIAFQTEEDCQVITKDIFKYKFNDLLEELVMYKINREFIAECSLLSIDI